MAAQRSVRRWLAYGVCLAPAIAMLAYYTLEYVPGQREYFMQLRFRSLSDINDHARMKLDSLLSALNKAPKTSVLDAEKYVHALVPDLRYLNKNCVPPPKLSIELGPGADTVLFRPLSGCAASASLSHILAPLVRDDLFDDVVIADAESGLVIYQRSGGAPRVASIKDLLKAPSDPKVAGAGSGAATDSDVVRYMQLDGSQYVVLMQPMRASTVDLSEKRLLVCGLVRSDSLGAEVRHVPPLYLLLIFAPLIAVFLSGPFLKIVLLTRTGRISFRDVVLLSTNAVISVFLLTLFLIAWRQYGAADADSDSAMRNFATSLNGQLVREIERMRTTLAAVDTRAPSDLSDRTGFDPLAEDFVRKEAGSPAFDFIFWTNESGCQVAKWTTKRFNTDRVDQNAMNHFQQLLAHNFWNIEGKQFTLQALMSPTTSQLVTVIAIPTAKNRATRGVCAETSADSPVVGAAIVGLFPSLARPVTPPGTGFAFFDTHGNVIFHSSPERNLHENLFDEIRSPEPWKAAVAMHTNRTAGAYYRGRKYRLHIQPVNEIEGSDWNVAVFTESEPRQAMVGVILTETLTLFLVPLFLLLVVSLLVAVSLRFTQGHTRRDQMEFLFSRIWPDPNRVDEYRGLAKELAILAVVSLALVILGSFNPYISAGWLFLLSYVAPLTALALTTWRLRTIEPSTNGCVPDSVKHPAYTACALLLLVLLAVVPPIGLFSASHAFENRLQVMHSQQDVMKSLRARRARIEAAINTSPGSPLERRKAALESFRLRGALFGWGGEDYLGSFWKPEKSGGENAGLAWWEVVLANVRVEAMSGYETGTLTRVRTLSGNCGWRTAESPARVILNCTDPESQRLAALTDSHGLASLLPGIRIGSDPVWWAGLLAIAAGSYSWISRALRRLFLQHFKYSPLPPLAALPPPERMQSDLLVLGLPLARKDEAVRLWLGYKPPRVNLYEVHFTENWVADTTAQLREELAESTGIAMQVAPGGRTLQTLRTTPGRRWVHISNLETKLADAKDRDTVICLVESLVTMDLGGFRPSLLVTSTVDPLFHFDGVLSDERRTQKAEYTLTEPEVQRLSRILHNFRKIQVSHPDMEPPPWAATTAGAAVFEECRRHLALLAIGEEVALTAAPDDSAEVLLARLAERAVALYRLFWACCTRSEKLLLVQLAETGLVNPLCLDTLQALVRKGLVLPGPRPRLINQTFLRFLLTVETRDTVAEWENDGGESSWPIIRNIVIVLLAGGFSVVALTQRDAMQTVIAAITGVGTLMAGLFKLMGFIGGRKAAPAEPAA